MEAELCVFIPAHVLKGPYECIDPQHEEHEEEHNGPEHRAWQQSKGFWVSNKGQTRT